MVLPARAAAMVGDGAGMAAAVRVGRARGAEAGWATGGALGEKISEKAANAALSALNARIRLLIGDIGTAFPPGQLLPNCNGEIVIGRG